MEIYNTLSGSLEEFKTIEPNKVKMYVCGPTVYNYAHVGNMLPPIVFDMIYRYFKYLGYDVTYVSNFTDVDDKIINSAIENNISEIELTEKFIKIYLENLEELNCLPITYRPKVTETMPEIIEFIQKMLDNGSAYISGDDVYFDTSKVSDYGILSKQNLEEIDAGSRIEVSENKHNVSDFVLWKKTDKGIKWQAPFGAGRPGWHTECVVMINKFLDSKIDIHGGGIDLKFPHHENERAQSIAVNNSTLANYWLHNGHVMVNGVKMSKSLGNFTLVKDLLAKYNSNTIRLVIFKSHYRTPIDFKDEIFMEAKTLDEKMQNVFKQANLQIKLNNYQIPKLAKDEKINAIMDDDFNTPNLLTYQSDLIKDLNMQIRNNTDFSQTYAKLLLINQILGLKYNQKTISDREIEIYQEWNKKRLEKKYNEADELRQKLVDFDIL